MMKRAILLLSLLAASPAFALTQGAQPSKFAIPWGNSAGSSYIRVIPQASQIGIQNCAASLTDGFPPLTFTPAAQGGCPPFGQDFNGILKQITQWLQWEAGGGPHLYDASFQTSIGGYPKGALVQSTILAGRVWYSTTDNNMTNPDDQTGATVNWIAQPGTNAAGTPIAQLGGPGTNTVSANGNTIGNASSNATNRANADTYWLFAFLWTNCGTLCQLYNSAGGTVSKGATFGADWTANRAIAVPDMRGTGMIGQDGGTGRLTGVPVTTGAITTIYSIVGENTHVLVVAELASHFHTTSTSDPGHNHVINISDPGHFHQASMAGVTHSHTAQVNDPGHYHAAGISDPSHGHNVSNSLVGTQSYINTWATNSGSGVGGGGAFGPAANFSILGNTTGVLVNGGGNGNNTVYSGGTGVYLTSGNGNNTVNSSATGDYVTSANGANQTATKVTGITATSNNNTTGITMTSPNGGNTTYSAGSGTAHNTVSRSILVNWNLAL